MSHFTGLAGVSGRSRDCPGMCSFRSSMKSTSVTATAEVQNTFVFVFALPSQELFRNCLIRRVKLTISD